MLGAKKELCVATSFAGKKKLWEKPFQKSVDENFSKAKFYIKHLSSKLEISLTNGRRCI